MRTLKSTVKTRTKRTRLIAAGTAAAVVVAPALYISQAAFAAPDPAAESAAQGQIINLDLGSLDLASLGFTQTSFPDEPGPDIGQLDIGVLQNQTLDLGPGLQLPLLKNAAGSGLISLGELGTLSSYAESASNTSSKASSGAIGSGGAIAVSPNTGVGTDPAYVDLTELFDQLNVAGLTDLILDQARVEVGALASAAGSNGDTATSEYVIAGANLKLRSPLIGTIATDLGDVIQGAVKPVSDLIETGGALNSLLQTVRTAASAIPLVSVNSAHVTIDGLDSVGQTVVDQLITTPIANNSGSVSIDLGTGQILLDVAKLIVESDSGANLNNLPANYDVISAGFINAVVNGVTESLAGITTKVSTILTETLNSLEVTLDINITAGVFPVQATGGVYVNGTLAQFAGTQTPAPIATTELNLLGIIDIGELLNPITAAVLAGVTGTTGPLVQGALDTVADGLGNVLDPVVAAVVNPLEPVLRGVLDQLVTLRINEQPAVGDLGAGSFTVRAISLGLLPNFGSSGLAKLSLASSTVRSAAEDDPVDNANASASAAASANADDDSNASAQAAAQAAADADANNTASAASTADATAAAQAAAQADASSTASADATTEANAAAQAAAQASANADADSAQDANASAAANANASAAASAAAEADASTNASANAAADADVDADADADVDGNVNASASAAASANADDDSNASAQAAAQAAADATAGAEADANGSSSSKGDDNLPKTGMNTSPWVLGVVVLMVLVGTGLVAAKRVGNRA